MTEGSGTVRFRADDVHHAAELVRRFATADDEITSWIDVRVVDPPDDVLPRTKGLLGREKTADAPSFQIIFGGGPDVGHTINLEARGVSIADQLTASDVSIPPGWQADGNKHAMLIEAPAGASAEALLAFGATAVSAILGGWEATLEATGAGAVSD
jgi:hypothetical protein